MYMKRVTPTLVDSTIAHGGFTDVVVYAGWASIVCVEPLLVNNAGRRSSTLSGTGTFVETTDSRVESGLEPSCGRKINIVELERVSIQIE
jgi:hypothetical protein